jgi:hypothetical protein
MLSVRRTLTKVGSTSLELRRLERHRDPRSGRLGRDIHGRFLCSAALAAQCRAVLCDLQDAFRADLYRTGRSRWWSVLAIIPIVNLIALWTLAYVRWPAIDDRHATSRSRSCTVPWSAVGRALYEAASASDVAPMRRLRSVGTSRRFGEVGAVERVTGGRRNECCRTTFGHPTQSRCVR